MACRGAEATPLGARGRGIGYRTLRPPPLPSAAVAHWQHRTQMGQAGPHTCLSVTQCSELARNLRQSRVTKASVSATLWWPGHLRFRGRGNVPVRACMDSLPSGNRESSPPSSHPSSPGQHFGLWICTQGGKQRVRVCSEGRNGYRNPESPGLGLGYPPSQPGPVGAWNMLQRWHKAGFRGTAPASKG